MPSLDLERDLHRLGRTLVAGVDEVGRGALAGPVMAGAVILPPDLDPSAPWLQGIDDSKKLTPLQRERAAKEIHQHALAVSVGEASPEEIDRLGIVAATRLAMVRAVSGLSPQPQHLLVDYISLEECGLPVTAVTHGDSLSHSIASAAIAAKVARDRHMVDVDARWPGYDFHKHKGYGTRMHIQQLNRLGPSPIHRFTFAPVRKAHLFHPKPTACLRPEAV